MKIFAFDPADHRDTYAREGWVHIPSGVDPEFLAVLQDFAHRRFAEHQVEGKAIAGTKVQALYEFPEEVEFPGELFDVTADTCGLDRPGMTLSERHIKHYDDDTPPDPVPHKDRFASQVSIGLSIDIPAGSRLVLYPHDDVWVNPYNVSSALLENLEPERHPAEALRDARPVEIEDRAGDVVMFRGSAMWHLRRDAANAINLYLKLNDFGSDPLGEDPLTPQRRAQTLAALEDGSLAGRVPVLARQLDTLDRQYLRDGAEVAVLRAVDGARDVAALAAGNGSLGDAEAAVRRLAREGVLDLLDAGAR